MYFSILCFSLFLATFQVLQCVFLIFHVFQFSRHIPGPTVCFSQFGSFSVFLIIFQDIHFSSQFFHVIQFSPHIPGHRVFVSHFPCFSVSSPYSRYYSVFFFHLSRYIPFFTIFQVLLLCFSFSMILHFHALLQVLQCAFLIYQVFPCFVPHNRSNNVCISFSMFFQFSHHDPGSRVCISHFSRF